MNTGFYDNMPTFGEDINYTNMKKSLYLLFSISYLLSCSGPDIKPTPQAKPKPTTPVVGGTVTTPPVTPTPAQPTLADVVDDKTWVDYLHGTWGIYKSGEGYKYDTYRYIFDRASEIVDYTHGHNDYVYILDSKSDYFKYKVKIEKEILYVPAAGGGYRKEAKFERISADEMKVFRIIESSSSYSEFNLGVFTKVSDTEKNSSEVIGDKAMKDVMSGKWKQDKNTIYSDLVFDFSESKNYYHYSYVFNEGKTIEKYEFKVDENGLLYYRKWASSFDPSWKKYFVEIVSDKNIKLYTFDNGKKAANPSFTLKR